MHDTTKTRWRNQAAAVRSAVPMLLAICLVVAFVAAAVAKDEKSTTKAAQSTTDGNSTEADAANEKERDVQAGALLLAMTVCVVLLAILALLLWGHRLRRLARKPLPEQTTNDPLWYLHAPKSNTAKSPVEGDREQEPPQS